MPGQDVGEDPHAKGDRPEEVGDHLDDDEQRRKVKRRARRQKEVEETQALLAQRQDVDVGEDRQRQRQGHDQVAGESELHWRQAEEAAKQDEDEKGKDERNRRRCVRRCYD